MEQGIPIFRSVEKNFLQEGGHEGKRPEKTLSSGIPSGRKGTGKNGLSSLLFPSQNRI
jgi:hypothetical protein